MDSCRQKPHADSYFNPSSCFHRCSFACWVEEGEEEVLLGARLRGRVKDHIRYSRWLGKHNDVAGRDRGGCCSGSLCLSCFEIRGNCPVVAGDDVPRWLRLPGRSRDCTLHCGNVYWHLSCSQK